MKATAVPLVLIHGVGLDHTMWLPVMSALPHRRTVTYDMIGHGRAAKPSGPYTLDTFVDQLAGVADALDCVVDLVGFSMGAMVAQGFAQSATSGRIRRMVLLNAVHDRTDSERSAVADRVVDVRGGGFAATVEPALQRWFTPPFFTAQPAIIEAVRRVLLENDLASYADAYEVFATADALLARGVADIGVPTLVATGGEDQRSTPAMAEALAAALPNGRSLVLPGLRHLTPCEAPNAIAAVIDEFTSH